MCSRVLLICFAVVCLTSRNFVASQPPAPGNGGPSPNGTPNGTAHQPSTLGTNATMPSGGATSGHQGMPDGQMHPGMPDGSMHQGMPDGHMQNMNGSMGHAPFTDNGTAHHGILDNNEGHSMPTGGDAMHTGHEGHMGGNWSHMDGNGHANMTSGGNWSHMDGNGHASMTSGVSAIAGQPASGSTPTPHPGVANINGPTKTTAAHFLQFDLNHPLWRSLANNASVNADKHMQMLRELLANQTKENEEKNNRVWITKACAHLDGHQRGGQIPVNATELQRFVSANRQRFVKNLNGSMNVAQASDVGKVATSFYALHCHPQRGEDEAEHGHDLQSVENMACGWLRQHNQNGTLHFPNVTDVEHFLKTHADVAHLLGNNSFVLENHFSSFNHTQFIRRHCHYHEDDSREDDDEGGVMPRVCHYLQAHQQSGNISEVQAFLGKHHDRLAAFLNGTNINVADPDTTKVAGALFHSFCSNPSSLTQSINPQSYVTHEGANKSIPIPEVCNFLQAHQNDSGQLPINVTTVKAFVNNNADVKQFLAGLNIDIETSADVTRAGKVFFAHFCHQNGTVPNRGGEHDNRVHDEHSGGHASMNGEPGSSSSAVSSNSSGNNTNSLNGFHKEHNASETNHPFST